jgi:hypothetical protein
MRYFIGVHTSQINGKTRAVAVATEVAEKLPIKYKKRQKWELEKLLPAYATACNSDEETAIKAVLQRIFEKMYLSGKIASPEIGAPPVTVYLPKKYQKLELKPRVLFAQKHWSIDLALKVVNQ